MTASEKTTEELGIGRHPPSTDVDEWRHYKTLASPPATHPQRDQWASSIYRGLVPARNITKRDFAINGAVVSNITSISTSFLIHSVATPSRLRYLIVHYEQWVWIRSDGALDIVVLSRGQDALTLDV